MDKFEFHYTATSLLAPERMKFKYLLDGYDKEWVDASTRRTAYYTNLPRGRQYVFRVKACNNDGVWNEVGASAMLYLVPYFWETWLFYGLCGMLLLSSGLGAYWLRVRQLQNRSKALEIVVENRTSELRDANIEISRQMEIQTEQAREIELANSSLQEANAALSDSHTALNEAHERSELLLLNVLPEPIAERLKAGERTIADHFDSVSVLFADVVGFTKLSSRTTPEGLVSLLDRLFSNFDRLAEQFGLEKIKTIGDAYMVVGGLPIPTDDHLERVALFALALLPLVNEMADEFEIRGLAMRIGIHTGEVVAGVIGKKKFTYDIWGDTVNTASRMESHGEAGKIHVSEEVYDALKEKFVFEERGEMEVKGKGVMRTFFLTGSTIADHPESDQ
jgi:class 3 adenylate cyclase